MRENYLCAHFNKETDAITGWSTVMLKKKFITAALVTATCAAMLASCGGNVAEQTTTAKPPLPGGKITRKANDDNILNDAKNSVEDGIDNVKNGIKRGMDDMMDNAEDATHGTARQDGRDNDTEAETERPMREHRPAAPKGK